MAGENHKQDQKLSDVQAAKDFRRIAIDRVGVKDVVFPVRLRTRDGGVQHTVATINMFVSLPHHERGTHMSRFLEILNDHCAELSPEETVSVCRDIRQKLDAQEAHLNMSFEYFIQKKAPVTGKPGMMNYQVAFEVTCNGHEDFILGVRVPATSLCPCSKEISAYGAHNQRCEMVARIRMKKMVWIEDLVEIAEQAASSQVYAVLKRPDEKYVTEYAFDHPRFVEDTIRELAVMLDEDPRIVWYDITSENFESIHNHNAFAGIQRDKRDG